MRITKLILYCLITGPLICYTQNKQILYGFSDIPQSTLQNPGEKTSYQGHAGIPFLSGIYANAGSSGFSVYDIFSDDGVNINTKIEGLIFSLSDSDIIALNQQMDLLYGGFKGTGKRDRNYYSFGVYEEIDFFTYWPKDLAILGYKGNYEYIGKTFDLGQVSAKGEMLTVFHFGIDKKINNKLTTGFRIKLYSGIIDFTSTRNTGIFYTDYGENNEYKHFITGDIQLKTSGYASLRKIDADNNTEGVKEVLKKFKQRALLGGNLGVGIDLGFTYEPSEKIVLKGSILDIGFIRHTKDVENYRFKGTYELEGLDLIFPEIIDDDGEVTDYWKDLEDDLKAMYDTTYTKYTTWRPVKLNGAFGYKFGSRSYQKCNCSSDQEDYNNMVGAQLFVLSRPKMPQAALTLFYYKSIAKALKIKTTYTVDKFSDTNIGFGISSHFGKFNFYILADNLLEYQNLAKANNASLQFGFNLIFQEKNK